jgi:Rieske Fe-S protein
VLDRGLHFAKLEPKRSYLLAFRHPSPPELMCISAGSDIRSVRDVPGENPVLLVGGSGHPVGREPSPGRHYDELRAWAAEHFPGAEETHAWSAQDYGAYSGVPIVGPILPGMDHVLVATGYDKWGMAAAVAAATSIAGGITGAPEQQRQWTAPWRPTPGSLLQACRINGEVALSLVEGVGRLGKVPLCTHLGGMLRWNDAERSWDCPLHGSRFDEDGSVLEGPATRPLPGGVPPEHAAG